MSISVSTSPNFPPKNTLPENLNFGPTKQHHSNKIRLTTKTSTSLPRWYLVVAALQHPLGHLLQYYSPPSREYCRPSPLPKLHQAHCPESKPNQPYRSNHRNWEWKLEPKIPWWGSVIFCTPTIIIWRFSDDGSVGKGSKTVPKSQRSWNHEIVAGWTNPFEKYQNGRVKMTNLWNHHLVNVHSDYWSCKKMKALTHHGIVALIFFRQVHWIHKGGSTVSIPRKHEPLAGCIWLRCQNSELSQNFTWNHLKMAPKGIGDFRNFWKPSL